MIRWAAVAAMMWAGGPALALSCLAPDVARDFQQADASDEVFIAVLGNLTFDPSRLPESDFVNQEQTPPETDIPARLEGRSLTRQGFTRAFTRDVTLRVLCFGPWCGGTTPGRVMAFLRRDGTEYTLFADPCGTRLYPDPRPDQIETITACMAGRACKPREM